MPPTKHDQSHLESGREAQAPRDVLGVLRLIVIHVERRAAPESFRRVLRDQARLEHAVMRRPVAARLRVVLAERGAARIYISVVPARRVKREQFAVSVWYGFLLRKSGFKRAKTGEIPAYRAALGPRYVARGCPGRGAPGECGNGPRAPLRGLGCRPRY